MNTAVPEKALVKHAIEALEKTTGLKITILKYEPFRAQADAYAELRINGKVYEYVIEIKNVDRFAALGQVKHQLEAFMHRPLLIARRLTDDAADKCRELNLNFIDLAGNAYINEPGFLIFIKGQKAKQLEHLEPRKGKRAGTPTQLRMVFTLLCRPEMLNAPYREIEKTAGIALGTIGWIFNDLDARGLMLGGAGKRLLVEREKLIKEWVINYPIKLRPKLGLQRFRTTDTNWWKDIDLTNFKARWGGEVAADKLTHNLKPDCFTVYIEDKDFQENVTRLVVKHKLKPDPQVNIEILKTFWDFAEEEAAPDIVPPLLIYADLLATNDPRNLEAAGMIYERFIKHADGQA